ncbi:MAG: phenylalanine--tRNA ligase subunit alpha [Rhodobacterales bacterium]|nr:phenylalanine--tRNA ligase subunit alpha [Rhodobacterales bacterium]
MSRSDVDALLNAFRADLNDANDPAAIDLVRRAHTGKKSPLKLALKGLRSVSPDERPQVAQAINQAQRSIESELANATQIAEAKALQDQIDQEWVDLSLPGLATPRGARHPLTDIEWQSMSVLRRLGFEVVDGPEVEHPFYNFDALNIPEHHPARDMQDTFWVDGGWLLRSHTTTVQARTLEARSELPIKIACFGRVYRNEAVDASHLAMFHQFEGLWIDKGLNFSHLKGALSFIVKEIYGDRPLRFKPKFYPYTEPSIGVDIACARCDGTGLQGEQSCESCHGAGWVTILGAGMVHPKLLIEFGFAPAEVSGIAFGLGTTRMAGVATGVSKIKSLYDTDLRVHHALHRGNQ